MPRGYWAIMVVLALALLAGQTASAVAQPAASAPAAVEEADGGGPPQGEATKESTTQQNGKAAGKKSRGPFDSMTLMIVMLGGFFLLYIWMGRSRRKQRRQRQEMLTSLKKGDKITSIGGIVGTVIEVRDDEVTVKVDETGNVRMKFARWAIRGVGEAGKAEDPAQAEKKP